ncbi:MAG TPA: amidoligase family protein [Noviherbaspirillum sp.]
MHNLINAAPAIRGSTATESPTVNDSASPLQGARPVPVPSILTGQDASSSLSTSDYAPNLHGAQVRQKTPITLLTEASFFGEQEKTKALKRHWTDSPNPQAGQTYRYLLDAARNLKALSGHFLWKPSFALIARHIPGTHGEFLSLCGQPSAPHKQPLAVNQTDTLVEAVAASANEALLSPEFSQDIGRLVKGYLQWRKEQSTLTEPISVSCCMQLLKSLQRDKCPASSKDDDNDIHEYLAKIVSHKHTALSEAATLEQQSPSLALFMYKLMEHVTPDLIASLSVDRNVLHKQPEVCALLAATLQGHFEIAEALTKNGSDIAQLQKQLWEINPYQLQKLLPGLLPLLRHDHAWTTRHFPLLKEMDEHQLQYLLPLLQHDQAWTTEHLPSLEKMDCAQLEYLFPLLKHNQAWTTGHLPSLEGMDGAQFLYLLPLLKHGQAWTTEHFPSLKEMSGAQLECLLPLLKHNQAWTSEHLHPLKEMNGAQLHHLLPLLEHDQAWTTEHLPSLKEMDENQLRHLLPLLRHNQAWTTKHLPSLKGMDGDQLQYLFPLLRHNQAWITRNLLHYQDKKDELRQLALFHFFSEMDSALGGFLSAANPYVREALSMYNQDMEELAEVLKTHGASRSTLHPEREIASYLTEKFKHNYQQIPGATFGVENEMFIPGIPKSHPSKIEHELNDKLGVKNKKYLYVKDKSLSTDAPFATPPIEQTTSILDTPEDIQRLQSALSILNDWGAFTNRTAGVHIHTGVKQWKAASCLNTPEERSKNRFLHQWDQELPQQSPETAITPYQLLFMKQFLVNMVAMQKEFYLVSRKSTYSAPNGPMNGNDLDTYYQDVSRARDYNELLSSANADNRYRNVNLTAYKKHRTIEVRGFTKKNSDSMEIDPNLPVRDLVFMQEVLIKVLHDTRHILLSGASPDDPIEVHPSAGLTEIAQEYVQDVFLLEALHALGQRDPERRVSTMEAMVQDKGLITADTLRKIRESQAALLEGDPLAQHFLDALNRDTEWNPSSFVERTPLKRTRSLRSMADAGLSIHEQMP